MFQNVRITKWWFKKVYHWEYCSFFSVGGGGIDCLVEPFFKNRKNQKGNEVVAFIFQNTSSFKIDIEKLVNSVIVHIFNETKLSGYYFLSINDYFLYYVSPHLINNTLYIQMLPQTGSFFVICKSILQSKQT